MMIKITIPMPDKRLNPNVKYNHMGKYRIGKKQKEDVILITRNEMRKYSGDPFPLKAITVQPIFYCKVKRRRDKDNALASLKSAFDGLVDAGLLVDDEQLTPLPVMFRIDRESPRVELIITW